MQLGSLASGVKLNPFVQVSCRNIANLGNWCLGRDILGTIYKSFHK